MLDVYLSKLEFRYRTDIFSFDAKPKPESNFNFQY